MAQRYGDRLLICFPQGFPGSTPGVGVYSLLLKMRLAEIFAAGIAIYLTFSFLLPMLLFPNQIFKTQVQKNREAESVCWKIQK